MQVNFFLYEQYHAKPGVGSSKIRGHGLIKYWPEASLYQFGRKPDVLIFQKVYVTYDYKFVQHFEGIKILDIADPDWRDSPDIYIKETLDAVDAVVTSSKSMAEYLQQMTDTKCLEIKDRFDMDEFPEPKKHFSKISKAVWFGYSHNAETIRLAVPSLEARGIKLLVVSNDDPAAWRWANKPDEFKLDYEYVKYPENDLEARKLIQGGDVALFPPGNRPFDKFKSENKSVIAKLCGLPVVTNSDELDAMMSAPAREKYIASVYNKLKDEYNVTRSVQEYQELIREIKANRR